MLLCNQQVAIESLRVITPWSFLNGERGSLSTEIWNQFINSESDSYIVSIKIVYTRRVNILPKLGRIWGNLAIITKRWEQTIIISNVLTMIIERGLSKTIIRGEVLWNWYRGVMCESLGESLDHLVLTTLFLTTDDFKHESQSRSTAGARQNNNFLNN